MAYRVKCIALDLDRTTLNREGHLTEENRAALQAALDAGLRVVVASGRPFGALPEEIVHFRGIEYAITGNGSTICRLPSGDRFRASYLPPEAVRQILDIARGEDFSYECFIAGRGYADAALLEDPVSHGSTQDAAAYLRATRTPVADMEGYILQHIEELDALDFITMTQELCDELAAKIDAAVEGVYLTASGSRLLEISSSMSGKHRALAALLEELELPLSDTAAFGDGDNDAEMLRMVGIGIAMGNATDSCKAAADYITADYTESGVAKGIARFLLTE